MKLKMTDHHAFRVVRCPHVEPRLQAALAGWHCAACTYYNEEEPAAGGRSAQVVCAVCESAQPRPPPADPGCSCVLPPPLLKALIGIGPDRFDTAPDLGAAEKYNRLAAQLEDGRYRECPHCQTPSTAGPTAQSNEIFCGACGETYCFVHLNAHPGKGCRQYERGRRADEKAAQRTIRQFTRPCPQCAIRIEKSADCNHMTCTKCGAHFCWICGKDLSAGGMVGRHFAPWNLAGCPGMMMEGARAYLYKIRPALKQVPYLCPPSCP